MKMKMNLQKKSHHINDEPWNEFESSFDESVANEPVELEVEPIEHAVVVTRPDDVVVFRPAKLEEPQIGFHPADAIPALGIASEDGPRGHLRAVGAGQIRGDAGGQVGAHQSLLYLLRLRRLAWFNFLFLRSDGFSKY